MPWIELTLADPADAAALAPTLAGAVAAALELGPSDVLVSVSVRAGVFDGRGPVDGWPAATLHGRGRDPAAMDRARHAAAAVLASSPGVTEDQVWVHWCTG